VEIFACRLNTFVDPDVRAATETCHIPSALRGRGREETPYNTTREFSDIVRRVGVGRGRRLRDSVTGRGWEGGARQRERAFAQGGRDVGWGVGRRTRTAGKRTSAWEERKVTVTVM
jgi:hypothetical protein